MFRKLQPTVSEELELVSQQPERVKVLVLHVLKRNGGHTVRPIAMMMVVASILFRFGFLFDANALVVWQPLTKVVGPSMLCAACAEYTAYRCRNALPETARHYCRTALVTPTPCMQLGKMRRKFHLVLRLHYLISCPTTTAFIVSKTYGLRVDPPTAHPVIV